MTSKNVEIWEQRGISTKAHHAADAIATAILDTLDGLLAMNASVSRTVVEEAAREAAFQFFVMSKQTLKRNR